MVKWKNREMEENVGTEERRGSKVVMSKMKWSVGLSGIIYFFSRPFFLFFFYLGLCFMFLFLNFFLIKRCVTFFPP